MPAEPEAIGLLALLLLIESRQPARVDANGEFVLLADQDRRRWDRRLLAEGQSLVRQCLRRNAPGPYQLQAAINAVHADAATAEETDWRQVLQLYDHLFRLTPTPVVALNRAIAFAEVHGAGEALAMIEHLELDHYHLFHATRADLLRRLGHKGEALAAYHCAAARTGNAAEHALIMRRIETLAAS